MGPGFEPQPDHEKTKNPLNFKGFCFFTPPEISANSSLQNQQLYNAGESQRPEPLVLLEIQFHIPPFKFYGLKVPHLTFVCGN